MKNKYLKSTFLLPLLCMSVVWAGCSSAVIYKDASFPVDKRVEDLLGRMTLEEKVGQMCQYVGLNHMHQSAVQLSETELKKSHAMGFYTDCPPEEVEKMIKSGITGSFLHVTTVDEVNYIKLLALQSRLGAPVLIGIDAMHGTGLVSGATVYPTEIGQASAFNPKLVEKIARQTALEICATGAQWTFAPNYRSGERCSLGTCRRYIWRRPHLVSMLGVVAVKGFQTQDFTGTDKVIACTKHMAGGN